MQRRVRMTVRTTVRVQRTVQVRRTVQTHAQQSSTQHRNASIAASSRALPASPSRLVSSLYEQGYGPLGDEEREFDVFLSHASENKDFVRPLARELTLLGVHVWFDETVLTVGESLRESIDRGLARSRFGIVVFSKEFFEKRWTSYELNGLVTREMQGRKVVLPVWHPELSHDELISYSPSMADKVALIGSQMSIRELAEELAELVVTRPH